jgi:hypothetical protein
MDAWWDVSVPDEWAATAAEIRALADGLPLFVYDRPEQVDQDAIARWLLRHPLPCSSAGVGRARLAERG